MRNAFRGAAVVVAVAALVSAGTIQANAASKSGKSDPIATVDEQGIAALYERRAEALLDDPSKVAGIEQEMASKGIEFLTADEVAQRFPEAGSANTLLAPMADQASASVTPNIPVPSQTNISWSDYRTNIIYGGTVYEVQVVTAQPNTLNSNLKNAGSAIVQKSGSWTAGVTNAVYAAGRSSAGLVSPQVGVALSVYDTVKAAISGFSPSTVVTGANVAYSWSHVNTVQFRWVKKAGQSDDLQQWSYVSTKGQTAIGWQYASFAYAGGSAKPYVIQGSRTFTSTPACYTNATTNALDAYNSGLVSKLCYLTSVDITGFAGYSAGSIHPLTPQFVSQIG